jgi:hypothetical protein
MEPLTVDPSGTHFIVGGSFVPLIIDTAWSSFADPSEDEWRMYLSARRRQGFTCVLVSVLPILHDRDERPTAREPFALDAAGHHDFARLDDRFFATAREFTRIAHEEYGLRLMIGVLWNNYLPGTWGAARTPHAVMPEQDRRAYVARVAETFGDLQPILAVGGDDHYTVPAANAGYRQALAQLRAAAGVPGGPGHLPDGPAVRGPPLDRLAPAQELLAGRAGDAVRLSASPDRAIVALYLPYASDVDVLLDLTGYHISGWDLAERAPLTADTVPNFFAQEHVINLASTGSPDLAFLRNPPVLVPVAGHLDRPTGPGLGIEIDEDAVRAAHRDDLLVPVGNPQWRYPDGGFAEW